MKQYALIANFDGAKFATRYGLSALRGDFFVDSTGLLNVPDNLPDDPPIQEVTDDPLLILRRLAVVLADDHSPASKLDRGLVAALLDELNNHAAKINAMIDAVNAATSLADLKTRFSTITDYPVRTMAQAITSIKNHIQNGDVD